MTIGKLAKKAGVNAQTIRYYEREGLLADAHRWPDSGYRDFDENAFAQMRFIRSAKELGFTLREIKDLLNLRLLPGQSCREMRMELERKIADIDRRLTQMRKIRKTLVKLAAGCSARGNTDSCPALWAIEQ
ncbi:MAG: heavy metal-responsive transcriptional regulator [Opitutaceae bacterium]|nr:heavy metal-responsive transcriptional regulator [Opitutaceae bacterium]